MTVCLLVVITGNTILNVAIPTVQRELGATQGQLQWAVDAYILVFAGLLFTWGVIGDRVGRKRVLLIGLAIFAAGSVLAAFSSSPLELIGWRAVMGIGGAAVQPTTLAVITNVFPARERGRAIGVWAGTAGIGVAGGPLAGGAVLEHFWWGSVFLVGVPVALLGIVAVLVFVPESKDPNPGRLDIPGVLLSIAALAGVVYGLIRGGSGVGWTTPGVLIPLLGGLLLLALFVWIQRRSTHPALDVSLFRNPAFSAAAAALGLNFFALLGATFYLVFYLQGVRGFTPLQSGAALIPVALGMALMAPRSSGLAERFGAKAVCASGFLLIALSFVGDPAARADVAGVAADRRALGAGPGHGRGDGAGHRVDHERGAAGEGRRGGRGQQLGPAGRRRPRRRDPRVGAGRLVRRAPGVGRRRAARRSRGRAPASRSWRPCRRSSRCRPVGTSDAARAAADLVVPAREAFVSAMHTTAVFTAGAAVVAAVVVLVWLPGRRRATTVAAVTD